MAAPKRAAPLQGEHCSYTLPKVAKIGAVAREASDARLERWRRIVREVAKQSGRGLAGYTFARSKGATC